MSYIHRTFMFTPRFGNARLIFGAQQRETDSAGELVGGFTLYTDEGDGAETYQANYVTLGARSDTAQNIIESLQGHDVTVRRVGDSEADAVYAGTPKENASHKVVNPDGKRGLKVKRAED